eukprot:94685-Rhodomonas_salina.2
MIAPSSPAEASSEESGAICTELTGPVCARRVRSHPEEVYRISPAVAHRVSGKAHRVSGKSHRVCLKGRSRSTGRGCCGVPVQRVGLRGGEEYRSRTARTGTWLPFAGPTRPRRTVCTVVPGAFVRLRSAGTRRTVLTLVQNSGTSTRYKPAARAPYATVESVAQPGTQALQSVTAEKASVTARKDCKRAAYRLQIRADAQTHRHACDSAKSNTEGQPAGTNCSGHARKGI